MNSKKEFSKRLSQNIGEYDITVNFINDYIKSKKIKNFSIFGPYNSYQEFPENNICLFVHTFYPVRRIGRVTKAAPKPATQELNEKLKYCLIPLIEKELNINDEFAFNERKPINLITKRRGVWLIYNIPLESKNIKEIYDYYKKYVKGMQFWNDKSDNIHYEQYDLDYPLIKTWKQGVYIPRKSRSTKKKAEETLPKLDMERIQVPEKFLKRSITTKFEEEEDFWKDVYGENIDNETVNKMCSNDDSSSEDSQNKLSTYKNWESSVYDNSPQAKKQKVEDKEIFDIEIPEVNIDWKNILLN